MKKLNEKIYMLIFVIVVLFILFFLKLIYKNSFNTTQIQKEEIIWDSTNPWIDETYVPIASEDKAIKKKYCSWPYYDLSAATNEAVTIVRGKVLSRSTETKGLPIIKMDGSIYGYDYYREVTVEVIDVIKGEKKEDTIIYKEPGGETEEYIYEMDGVVPLNIGEEYIFFLMENNTFLNPATVITISNETVNPSPSLAPENTHNTQAYDMAVGIPIDDFIEAIKSELE